MSGPWDSYATVPAEAGPWTKYAAPDASQIPTGQGGGFFENIGAGIQQGIGNVAGNVAQWALGKTDPAEAQRLAEFRASENQQVENKYGGSTAYKAGVLGGEIGVTAPVGGALGGVASLARLPRLANALASSGFTTGAAAAPTLAGRAADLGIRTIGGAATGGATAGLVNTDEAGTGALIGGVLPGTLKGLGAVGGAIAPRGMDVAKAALAQEMIDRGINIFPSQLTQSPITKATASILKDAPLTSGIARNALDTQQEQLNNALAKTIGQSADRLNEGTMAAARSDIGNRLNAVWSNNNLPLSPAFVNDIQAVRNRAMREQPGPQGQGLANKIDDFLAKADKGEISGEAANRFQSSLRKMPDDLSAETRRTVLSYFNNSLTGADQEALALARNQYGNLKTLEPLADKSVVGDISPANLLARVAAGGNRSDLVPLAKGAKEFMIDRTAQTGGSLRALLQSGLMAGTGAAAVGLGIPTTALGVAGLGTVGALVQKGLVSPAIGEAMVRNALARTAQPNALSLGNRLTEAALPLIYRGAPLLSSGQ